MKPLSSNILIGFFFKALGEFSKTKYTSNHIFPSTPLSALRNKFEQDRDGDKKKKDYKDEFDLLFL